MLHILKTAALSAMIGLGAVAAIPVTAQAQSIYLNMGDRDAPRVGVQFGRDSADYRRYDRRDDRRYDRRDDRRFERACSSERALDKAERLGLRRARVVDVDRRTIRVSGRKFNQRVSVTFARAPGCPILSR